ncbi:MAG: hypothetical protein WCE75_07115, partial [Terracidiphilus sp.]
MPTSETPTQGNLPEEQPALSVAPAPEPERPASVPLPLVSTSRWIDYDTHELLEMISELEDERRWARLREGVLWAVLLHAVLLFALFLLPKYVFPPRVVEPDLAKLHDRDEWTYLDSPRFRPKPPAEKPTLNTPTEKPAIIDKKTLEEMNKPAAPPAPQPAPA